MVIELVEFQLKPELRDEAFALVVADTTLYLKTLYGFRGRRIAKGDGGVWLDHVEWDSMDDALQAAESFRREPCGISFKRCVVPGSTVVRHFEVFHSAT